MTEPFDPQAYTHAMAKALDLPLDAADPAAVAANVAVAFRLAPLFLSFPLDDEAEPAPVFDACEAKP
ncbi:MAG: AtzG-like protein [Beijerinckiaceae bacterium]